MNFPPSIFCGNNNCESGCKLPRKINNNNNNNVMIDPVILQCSHKYCYSCYYNKLNKKCSLCNNNNDNSPCVDVILQEICAWFRSNESLFISEGVTLNGASKKPVNGATSPSASSRPLPAPLPRSKSSSSDSNNSNNNNISVIIPSSSIPSPSPSPSIAISPSSSSALSSSPSPSPPSQINLLPRASPPVPPLARGTHKRNASSNASTSSAADTPVSPTHSNPPTPSSPLIHSSSSPRKPVPIRSSNSGDSKPAPSLSFSPPSSILSTSTSSPSVPSTLPIKTNPLTRSLDATSHNNANSNTSSPATSPPSSAATSPREGEPSDKVPKPLPPPKPKVKAGTLRLHSTTHLYDPSALSTSPSSSSSILSSSPTSAATPPTPPLKPKKPNRLMNRPQSSPDLNKLISPDAINRSLRGPKAEDISKLFASLGTGELDFGKSYDWATKPVDPASLIWHDNVDEKMFARIEGWVNEKSRAIPYKFAIEAKDKDVLWYASHLHGKDHVMYLGGDEENVHLFAIETSEGDHPQPFKVLVITKDGVERIWIPESSSLKQRIKAIHQSVPTCPKPNQMVHVKNPEISQELLKWEQRSVFKSYKFGILYCKEGQSTEEEIFGNEHGSPEFEEFLNCMGERVSLKGWTQYSGGLNVDAGLEGSHSVYTQYEAFEIMFHVSTLLPFNPDDPQQLARKRHIGNDMVAIVFMDGPCPPLKPNFIRTQFIHVFIIVQLIRGGPGQKNKYKLSVAAKNDVRPFSPFLPDESVTLENGPYLREFLLTKLINAERASLGAVSFRDRMGKARHLFLNNLLEVYGK